MVEWTRFAEQAGVNLYEVVKAIRMRPTHKNIMLPGIGVGGYCLTKDPLLASWANQEFFAGAGLQQSEKGVRINDKMPIYAFQYLSENIAKLDTRKVLLLGVSYRQDVGDTRYTPVETFYRCLTEAGSKVLLHDPHVAYWEELNLNVASDYSSLLKHKPDVIVISTGHSIYKTKEFQEKIMELSPILLYDTIGIFTEEQIIKFKSKHIVKVLGRGDI